MPYQHILVDDPRPRVRRITLNRPEKRNALNNRLRAEVFDVLEAADRDADISISILRGAGPCFSAGYDLSSDNSVDQPYHSAAGPGQWSRHVVEGWFSIWDLAKPVIAQVHGLRRRRCPDRISAGAADEPAGHAISSVAGRHAPRHGADADR